MRATTLLLASFAAAALLAAAPLGAQVLHGELEDDRTGLAVEGAPVVLLDSAGKEVHRVRTRRDGEFRLRVPAPGRYRVRAELEGRFLISGVLEVGDGDVEDVEVELRPAAPPPPRDTLVALPADATPDLRSLADRDADARRRLEAEGFFERMSTGIGVQLSRGELETRPGATLLDRLAGIGEMQIGRDAAGRPLIRIGGCDATVWIDGIPRPARALEEIAVDRVDAVEVYAAAELPSRFRLPGAPDPPACGALALWLSESAG